jgi:hypothetical protein
MALACYAADCIGEFLGDSFNEIRVTQVGGNLQQR